MTRAHLLLGSLLLTVLASSGCIAVDMVGEAEATEVGVAGSALTGDNGLRPNGLLVNGIKLNGLKINGLKINGLKINGIKLNGLKINGLKINGIDSPTSEKALRYIVECSQATGSSVTVVDQDDPNFKKTFYGALNEGASDPLTTLDQQKVSACVIARMNAQGVSHTVDLVGNGLVPTGGAYAYEEAKYWGNLFAETGATLNACVMHGANLSDTSKYVYTGRTCWMTGSGANPYSGQGPGDNDCGIPTPSQCAYVSAPSTAQSVFVTVPYCTAFGCY